MVNLINVPGSWQKGSGSEPPCYLLEDISRYAPAQTAAINRLIHWVTSPLGPFLSLGLNSRNPSFLFYYIFLASAFLYRTQGIRLEEGFGGPIGTGAGRERRRPRRSQFHPRRPGSQASWGTVRRTKFRVLLEPDLYTHSGWTTTTC